MKYWKRQVSDVHEHILSRDSATGLRAMFGIAILGAILAGVYGALHDQVSYTISPEYFTKMKFEQFHYANFGWPQRVFASEVGFLASWWVGMIGGWVLARVGLDQLAPQTRGWEIAVAFTIVFVTALVSGCVGTLLGFLASRSSDLGGWKQWRDLLQLTDLRSFIIVAYLHWASYFGDFARRDRRRGLCPPALAAIETLGIPRGLLAPQRHCAA